MSAQPETTRTFVKDLAALINTYGFDNLLEAPDFILAHHPTQALTNLGNAIAQRDDLRQPTEKTP